LLPNWDKWEGFNYVKCDEVPDLRPGGFRKHRHVNENLAGTRLILSDAVLAELSQARRTYRLSQQETD